MFAAPISVNAAKKRAKAATFLPATSITAGRYIFAVSRTTYASGKTPFVYYSIAVCQQK